jgi:hypothetical protein
MRRDGLGKHPTAETREKIRRSKLGTHHSPETIEKLRHCRLGCHQSPESIEKTRQAHLGKHLTAEHKKKIGLANSGKPSKLRGRHLSAEHKEKDRQAHIGKHHTKETIEKIRTSKTTPYAIELARQGRLGKHHTYGAIERNRQAHLGKHLSPEHAEKIRQGHRTPEAREKMRQSTHRCFKDPEFLKKWSKSNHSKTRPEKKVHTHLDSVHPNKFGYNGQGQLGIHPDGLTPDFVRLDGIKQVIEVFGSYWHSDPNEVNEKQERYAKHGYESLFIWDYELKDRTAVVQKTSEFVGEEPHHYFKEGIT